MKPAPRESGAPRLRDPAAVLALLIVADQSVGVSRVRARTDPLAATSEIARWLSTQLARRLDGLRNASPTPRSGLRPDSPSSQRAPRSRRTVPTPTTPASCSPADFTRHPAGRPVHAERADHRYDRLSRWRPSSCPSWCLMCHRREDAGMVRLVRMRTTGSKIPSTSAASFPATRHGSLGIANVDERLRSATRQFGLVIEMLPKPELP
jgi:hypothetical protein